jgi:hypothetical protein
MSAFGGKADIIQGKADIIQGKADIKKMSANNPKRHPAMARKQGFA